MSRDGDAFLERCLRGEVLSSDIDGYVTAWHNGSDERSLSEFLGFTPDEYAIWVEYPQSLRYIIYSRKNNMPLGSVLDRMSDKSLAARAATSDEALELTRYLKRTGRL